MIRIAIFGVGAMASLFGAKLTPHANVTLIGHWPEQIAALSFAPMRLIYSDAHEEAIQVRATTDEDAPRPIDIALILTKSAGTAAAAEHAARILAPNGIAVTLQNGLGNLEILASHLGENRAVLGVTTQGAALDAPGILRIGGTGSTYLSITSPSPNSERGAGGEVLIAELAALLNESGLITELVPDVSALVWGKLAVNAAINPLTALLRVKNGALLDSPHTRTLMSEAAREVAAIAAALGINLPFDAATRAEEVARLTGPNRSSMLSDVLRGAPTEIEAINGAVMRKGAECGIPTPTNAMLYHLIKALEASYTTRIAP